MGNKRQTAGHKGYYKRKRKRKAESEFITPFGASIILGMLVGYGLAESRRKSNNKRRKNGKQKT